MTKRRNGCGNERVKLKSLILATTTMATTMPLTPRLAADNEPAKRLHEAAAWR